MSVNFYSYIGPVLEISKNPIEIVFEKTICPNKHNVGEHDKFCKHCGEKTIKVGEIQKKIINVREDDETGILDDLTCINDSTNIFIFDDDLGITLCDWNDDAYDGIEISSDGIKDIENKFYEDEYVKEIISYLTEKYGKESFSITFKFIIYAS